MGSEGTLLFVTSADGCVFMLEAKEWELPKMPRKYAAPFTLESTLAIRLEDDCHWLSYQRKHAVCSTRGDWDKLRCRE